jgi:hypothetical protein
MVIFSHELFTLKEKGKPIERLGRKATDLLFYTMMAELPIF